ncbi:MAG: MFS transporter [Gammaproteobacteria bacterium]|nr:MFS transporter [Gammaproteobacteria bacterium]
MNTTAENNRSIWHNSDFVKFFLSFTIGNLGDWFDFFALQIIVVHRFGGSPVEVSLLIVVYMLPFALFSVFSGIVVDRFNKKWLLFFTDFFSGLLTLGMIFAPKMIILMPLIFIRSTISNFNSPSQQAAVKQLVLPQQLLKASAYSAIAFQLCRILGPLLGAVVIAHYSARFCLSINAVSFFVSAVILLSMRAKKLDSVKFFL